MRVGVDEAGRGAACGPLVVAAAALPADADFSWIDRDSKRMSTKRRSDTLRLAAQMGARWVTIVEPAVVVDSYNLDDLERRMAAAAIEGLEVPRTSRIVADGPVFDNLPYMMENFLGTFVCEPRADEKWPEVALASVAAKVKRDDEWFGICEEHGIKLNGWGYPTSSTEIQIREWMARNPGETFPELRRSWKWAENRGLLT